MIGLMSFYEHRTVEDGIIKPKDMYRFFKQG